MVFFEGEDKSFFTSSPYTTNNRNSKQTHKLPHKIPLRALFKCYL